MRFQSHAWGNWQTGRIPVGEGGSLHFYTGEEENYLVFAKLKEKRKKICNQKSIWLKRAQQLYTGEEENYLVFAKLKIFCNQKSLYD